MKLNEVIYTTVKAVDIKLEKVINDFAEETGLDITEIKLMKTIDAFGKTTYLVVTRVELP